MSPRSRYRAGYNNKSASGSSTEVYIGLTDCKQMTAGSGDCDCECRILQC